MTENPQKERNPWFRRKWPWMAAAAVIVAAGIAVTAILLPSEAETPERALREPVVFAQQDKLMALFPGEKEVKELGYFRSNLFSVTCSSDSSALVWVDSGNSNGYYADKNTEKTLVGENADWVEISPDGRFVYCLCRKYDSETVASGPMELLCYDTTSGQSQVVLSGMEGQVSLVSESQDGLVKIITLSSGTYWLNLETGVAGVLTEKDVEHILAVSQGGSRVYYFQGRNLVGQSLGKEPEVLVENIGNAYFYPDGTGYYTMTYGEEKGLYWFDGNKGTLLDAQVNLDTLQSIGDSYRSSFDNLEMLLYLREGEDTLYTVCGGQVQPWLEGPTSIGYTVLQNGTLYYLPTEGEERSIWTAELVDGTLSSPEERVTGIPADINSFIVSENGDVLYLRTEDGEFRFYSNGRLLEESPDTSTSERIQIPPSGGIYFIGDMNGDRALTFAKEGRKTVLAKNVRQYVVLRENCVAALQGEQGEQKLLLWEGQGDPVVLSENAREIFPVDTTGAEE